MNRRRWTYATVLALAVVPAVFLLLGVLFGDRERMVSYFEVATIGDDGSARVDEVIDYDFGAGAERHGIIRIVPDLLDPSSVTVSSPSAPEQAEIVGGRIRIGDPGVTITGTHRYEIGYELQTLTRGDALAWNVAGTEWDVEIESIEAHVVSTRALDRVRCDQGSFGSVGGCTATHVAPGHVVVETGPVPPGHAVTIRATLGAAVDVSAAPPAPAPVGETGAPLLMPALLGFVLAAAAGRATTRVLRRAGREQAPAGYQGTAPATTAGPVPAPPGTVDPFASVGRVDVDDLLADAGPRVAPPRLLTPPQGGVVLAEKVRAEHQAAWLLGQADHGALTLDGDPKAPTMRWSGGNGAIDNAPLLTMFGGRRSVELGTYDPQFAVGWKMIGAELRSWRSTSGLWSERGERRRRQAIAAGLLVLVGGALVAALFGYRWSSAEPSEIELALLCVPWGVGAGLVAAAWELRVRTPEGSALYVDVEGFRRYLSDVDARR
ncbi:MAG: DUF2207 domain-containing protein [Acidimicrobiales bacterium]